MGRIHIKVNGTIHAPAAEVYTLLADYRNGHPLVVPKQYFSPLVVEEGGYGAGTVVSFRVKVGGNTRRYRDVVTEPQPGRILMESDTLSNTVTSFTVTPRGDSQCELEIVTDFDSSKGGRGLLEMLFAPNMMKGIYEKELRQIDQLATQRHASKQATA